MKNKVLIKLFVPMLGETFDVFIPVNEIVWKINKLIVKSVSDLSDGFLPMNNNYVLINTDTGMIYNSNDIILNTDVRNYSKIALIEV